MRTSFIFAHLMFAAGLLAQDTSATVRGQVQGFTGVPIAGANAELTLDQPPQTIFSVRTDEQGRFRFTVLPPGTYTLKLAQLGFKRLTLKSIQVAAGEQRQLPPMRIDVGSFGGCGGPFVDYYELSSAPQTGDLRGRVLWGDHRPIKRATVKLLSDRKLWTETKTGSDGEFIFLDLPPGQLFSIRVTHPGYYALEESDYEVQAGFDSIYSPINLEHCPNGNCDPRLRPKRPLIVCE
ncbi:MAG TPA: carboxypeptidase-like regulatory domain-containing protein [Bryobacteraceae bacterium]|nr:carboxypeptidase-like regulatory domain-containing protein [Bryobacteraceae bacterium]